MHIIGKKKIKENLSLYLILVIRIKMNLTLRKNNNK